MFKTSIEVKQGLGSPIAHALRSIAMVQLPAWKPVAFALDSPFDLIQTAPHIMEDTFVIASQLEKLEYRYKHHEGIGEDFLKETFKFSKELTPSGMNSMYFNIVGEESPIISSITDQQIQLTVIYRKASGLQNTMANTEFLEKNGEDVNKLFVMSSRHTTVKNFTFNISPKSAGLEDLHIIVESEAGDETKILEGTLDIVMNSVYNIRNHISIPSA